MGLQRYGRAVGTPFPPPTAQSLRTNSAHYGRPPSDYRVTYYSCCTCADSSHLCIGYVQSAPPISGCGLESRMRKIRPSGLGGRGSALRFSYPHRSWVAWARVAVVRG